MAGVALFFVILSLREGEERGVAEPRDCGSFACVTATHLVNTALAMTPAARCFSVADKWRSQAL